MSTLCRIKWKSVEEETFASLKGDFPRCYIAMKLLLELGGKATPSQLREEVKRINISYRTILRGLNQLVSEGLIERRDNKYILSNEALKAMSLEKNFRKKVMKEIENLLNKISRLKYIEREFEIVKNELRIIRDGVVNNIKKINKENKPTLNILQDFITLFLEKALDEAEHIIRVEEAEREAKYIIEEGLKERIRRERMQNPNAESIQKWMYH